jgi:hypothetical protein
VKVLVIRIGNPLDESVGPAIEPHTTTIHKYVLAKHFQGECNIDVVCILFANHKTVPFLESLQLYFVYDFSWL